MELSVNLIAEHNGELTPATLTLTLTDDIFNVTAVTLSGTNSRGEAYTTSKTVSSRSLEAPLKTGFALVGDTAAAGRTRTFALSTYWDGLFPQSISGVNRYRFARFACATERDEAILLAVARRDHDELADALALPAVSDALPAVSETVAEPVITDAQPVIVTDAHRDAARALYAAEFGEAAAKRNASRVSALAALMAAHAVTGLREVRTDSRTAQQMQAAPAPGTSVIGVTSTSSTTRVVVVADYE